MSGSRYAIYFVPAEDSALYRLGSSILGYDCYSGLDVSFPPETPLAESEWRALTAAPRLYGFHATLKAPFALASGMRIADLEAALRSLAASVAIAPQFLPAVKLLENFIAIVPAEPSEALYRLAAQCVTALDHFRAPLTAPDRTRRLQALLTERQISNLDRWGYPYVFDDFRFHMTLTGPVGSPGGEPAIGYLRELCGTVLGDHPIRVDRLTLLEQEEPGARFRAIFQTGIGQG